MHLFEAEQQFEFLPRLIALGGMIIVLLSVLFFIFIIFSRQHRNRLVLKNAAMQEEFEKQLIQSQLEVQENTFFQLAQELHDNVGQLLSSAKLLLGITERNLDPIPDSLLMAEDTLGKAIHDLRSLTKSLNSEWLNQFNLVENLQAELDRIKAARQIQVSLVTNASTLPLGTKEQIMIFRVVQEALQNCIKHSQADAIVIEVNLEPNRLYLTIADNGLGFDSKQASRSGIGIMNMKHRTSLLGGEITWASNIDAGTRVSIILPVKKSSI